MPNETPTSAIHAATEAIRPYGSSWEHLGDELKRLDFYISLRLGWRGSKTQANPLDHLRGLVITEEEVAALMGSTGGEDAPGKLSRETDPGVQAASEAIGVLDRVIAQRLAASRKSGVGLSLPRLAELFGLSDFEIACLIACLAPELNLKYDKLYAFLQDDITRKKPSVNLVLNLFCPNAAAKLSARPAFTPEAALFKYRLLSMTEEAGANSNSLLSRALKMDDRLVDFLLDQNRLDGRIASALKKTSPGAENGPGSFPAELLDRIRNLVTVNLKPQGAPVPGLVFILHGAPGSGRLALAQTVAGSLGFQLVCADAGQLLDGAVPFGEAVWLAGREALFQSAFLCFEQCDALIEDNAGRLETALFKAADAFAPVTFLLSERGWRPRGPFKRDQWVIHLDVPALDISKRRDYWKRMLPDKLAMAESDWGALASKFRLTAGQIQNAVSDARTLAAWRSPGESSVTLADLYSACRAQSEPRFGRLARKIEPRHEWKDIVLPEESIDQLQELCRQVAHRDTVLGDWGFGRKLSGGKGSNALFAGPSGTGKTMAAQVIARELKLNLYKIDLSQIVSKYIGETEKNLDGVFAAAESANAVLFFDEADALFGKRSEVRDSHDRYANIEISYLLQKMEEYDGVAILATNLQQNVDEAFARRLAFTVYFPFPDKADRQRIWASVWPEQTPVAKDTDFTFLARHFQLSGGNIKNVALAASYLAAGNGGVVNMSHIVQATRREYQKMGKIPPETGLDAPNQPDLTHH
jgi:SpoVK/Ycf46/Vps4 family AAA+-type ATPase